MYRVHSTSKIHHIGYPYVDVVEALLAKQDDYSAAYHVSFASATILERFLDDRPDDQPCRIDAILAFQYDCVTTKHLEALLKTLIPFTGDAPFAVCFDAKKGIMLVYHTTFMGDPNYEHTLD